MTVVATREAILRWIKTELEKIGGIAYLKRSAPGDPDSFPAICIEDGGHSPDVETEPGVTRYTMSVYIEGYVQTECGEEAEGDMNQLYLDVVRKLMVEPPCGGLAEEINEGEFRSDIALLGSVRRMGFNLTIIITFAASRTSPEAEI